MNAQEDQLWSFENYKSAEAHKVHLLLALINKLDFGRVESSWQQCYEVCDNLTNVMFQAKFHILELQKYLYCIHKL